MVKTYAGMILLVAAGAAAAAVPVPNQLPTVDDVQSLIDARQYPDALSQLRRLLDLKGQAAAKYDHHQLEMLRVECLLQMHNMDDAIKTLINAQNDAAKQTDMDEATAMITLLHRAPRFNFAPKAPGSKVLSILDKDQRKQAFAALWNEAEPIAIAATRANTKYTTMKALMDDAEKMEIGRGFEYMATGKTTTSDKWAATLHDKAIALLNTELSSMNVKIEQVVRRANATVTERVSGAGTRTHRAGLSRADMQTLDDVQSTAKQFGPAMTTMGQYFVADAKTFSAFTAKAAAIASQASQAQRTVY